MNKIEQYFIQFLFTTNRSLLQKEYRPLYDALFEKYEALYKEGKKRNQDLGTINDSFVQDFGLSVLLKEER